MQEESDNDTGESDGSENSDDSKLAALSLHPPPPQRPLSTTSGSTQVSVRPEPKRFRGWEILDGLREGQTFEQKPEKFEGFMMKRRKWPMKGWHKVLTSFAPFHIMTQ